MKLHTVHLFRLLICLMLPATLADPVLAQGRGRRGSELDLLRNEDILQEIGVSSEVIDQLDALRRNTTTTRAAFEQFRDEMSAAKTDDERTTIREKIQEAVKAGGRQFQQQALNLLNPAQQGQLRRVYIRNYGVEALADDRIAADLQLEDDQRGQISELIKARRATGSDDDLSASDADADRQEWDGKLLAVLSKKQLAVWKQQTSADESRVPVGEAMDSGLRSGSESDTNVRAAALPETGETLANFGAGPTEPGQKIQTFSFNFRYAPWDRVLQMFADGAGLTLDMQRVPPGTLSHLDHREYTATQALDIMNGYLIRKGFGIVEKDGFLIVVNLDEQLDQSLVPEVTLAQLQKTGDEKTVGDHQLVTIRVPVAGLDTGRTAQEIESLLGPWGSMVALTQSQIIMVTDIGANLRRILGLLEAASRPDELVFTPYHLKNIDVEAAEPLLLTQFGMRQAATNVSSAAEGRSFRDSRSRAGRTSTPATPTPTESLQVASDVRTNSLLVTGTPTQHVLVATILEAIDVSEAPDGQPLSRTGRRGKYLMVYDVSSADAREVTKTLDAIMPGIVVNEDGRNGKIHIMAGEREHDEVSLLIRQLDGAGGRQSVAVIPLIKMDPMMAAATLRSLFLSDGDEAPTLETDLYGRRLIVRGDPDQVTQIKAVLAQLGEDGSGVRPPSANGSRRRYSLQGRSPNEFLRILQDTWNDSEPNPIRIVVPSRSGPVRERRTTDGTVDPSEDDPPNEQTRHELPGELPVRRAPDAPPAAVRREYLAVRHQDAASGVPEAMPDDVVVTVLGDDLLLSSDDPEALDRLEELLDSLQQTLPYRTRWTVFYLQAADATEAADMLAQIFPSSSVASTTASTDGSVLGSLANSFSGIGSSLVDATGLGGLGESPQTLRIIPDVRSNSLLVAGPDAVLQDVWAMLNVLDSSDIPESFRDMQQRTITLEYANIDNVATILRDVYRPLMENQNANRQRSQQNPFAAMLGAGGGNPESSASVQMTLGIDRQTSSLIISSSQEIFDDVNKLVESLDKNAMSANRRIRVVQLRSADPLVIQRSLTGLFPRVSTSVSSSRTGGGNDSTGSNEQRQRASDNDQAADAIRRFRERAERRQQGGGTENQGGGGARGTGTRGNGGRGGRGGQRSGR